MAGYKAFQERMMGVNLLDDSNFTDFEARKLRYAIMWAMYENNAYSKIHLFSQKYKSDYGMYRHTRGVYNPAYRLGEFWKGHLLGGKLDKDAGDGSETRSALPIITENDMLRRAISQIWRWSNWQIKKDVLSLWTPIMGDGVIKIMDKPDEGRVYLKPIQPSVLAELTLDSRGNVKGYVIEEMRQDPRPGRGDGKVLYREIAFREKGDDNVYYQTYLNDKLYAWDDDSAEWRVPYGFVPMVVLQHNDVGLDWGFSELLSGLPKFREVDDLASKLSDQVRKYVDPPFLFSGVNKPTRQPKVQGEESTSGNPQPSREEVPALYGPAGSDAKALVADISIADAASYIKDILSDIERDYPELNADMHNVKGEISGRALRINRGPAEDKVLQRRPNYDDALVRAQQMAMSIGGWRGYDGFDGITLESYYAGALDHTIGDRPVFSKDPMDDLERDKEFWTVAKAAKSFGIPMLVYLEQQGWTEDQIAKVKNSPEYQAHMAALESAMEGSRLPPQTNRFGRRQNDQ
jgi:hypothetical protein